MSYKILAINPGSTSTKISLYEDDNEIFVKAIDHESDIIDKFDEIIDQMDFRAEVLKKVLEEETADTATLSAVVGRGGLLPNLEAGGYLVNEKMKNIIKDGNLSPHVSNLGALLADSVAAPYGIPAYIYDAVTSDEFPNLAKITGIPSVRRQSMCHVLNQKAAARKVASDNGKKYEEIRTVVAHLGGGITMGAHEFGKIIDCVRDDAGPFSPERSGSVPLLYVIDMCYSGEYTKREMVKKIRGMGGLKAYLGTADCRKIEDLILKGDGKAEALYEAQAYQIAKGIGEMLPVFTGKIDYIILTGGMAYSKKMVDMVTERVKYFAEVVVVPGENEMRSLSLGAFRLLRGEEIAKEYK